MNDIYVFCSRTSGLFLVRKIGTQILYFVDIAEASSYSNFIDEYYTSGKDTPDVFSDFDKALDELGNKKPH